MEAFAVIFKIILTSLALTLEAVLEELNCIMLLRMVCMR